jgi:hypothetical protein
MKQYNSVFTVAISLDHNRVDAGDITKDDIREALLAKLSDVSNHAPSETLVTGPEDTNSNYPFNDGDVYWSVDYSDDGRPMVNVSVWDDVSAEDYTESDMVYGSSYEAMVMFIDLHIAEEFPWCKNPYRGAEWTLQWMSNNGFRMPMHVGDHVFLKDIALGITEWLNR